MDLKLPNATAYATNALRSTAVQPKSLIATGGIGEAKIAGFSQALKGALQQVSAAQNQAESMQREVTLDNPKVSLEETMVAIQKAQIGFQATLHVRNRMVQAYSDIMNMQV